MPSYVRPGIRKCAKNRALSDSLCIMGAGSCAIDYEPQEALDVMIPIMTLLKFLYQ